MDINRKTAYKVLLRMEQTDAYSNIELNAQLKQEQPDSRVLSGNWFMVLQREDCIWISSCHSWYQEG